MNLRVVWLSRGTSKPEKIQGKLPPDFEQQIECNADAAFLDHTSVAE